jgi:outer membrane protein OmpA-like peptidoglycan-associated protein
MKVLLLLWISLLLAPQAQAAAAIDTARFRPAGSPRAGGMLEAVGTGEPWRLDLGVSLQFERRPVVFTDAGMPSADAIVAGRFGTVLRAGYAIGDRFRIGLDVPVTLYQAGVDPTTGDVLEPGGLGDIRLLPHVQILDPRKKWLGLALSVPVTLPTGRSEAMLSEGLPTVHPRLVAEKILASPVHPLLRFTAAVEAGYHLRPPTKLLDLDTAGAFTFGLGLRWEGLDFLRIGTEGVAAIGEGENFRHGEWITWGELLVDRRRQLAVTVGTGLGIGRGVGTPEGRIYASLQATFDTRRTPVSAPPVAALEDRLELAEEQPPLPGDAAGYGLRLVGRPASIDARVLFDVDSARLRSPARTVLDAVARWFLGHQGAGVLVVSGHADPRGGSTYNLSLSQRRADAVREHLVSAGVPSELVNVQAYGEKLPARSREGGATDRWAADRRVVFSIVQNGPSSAPSPVR